MFLTTGIPYSTRDAPKIVKSDTHDLGGRESSWVFKYDKSPFCFIMVLHLNLRVSSMTKEYDTLTFNQVSQVRDLHGLLDS